MLIFTKNSISKSEYIKHLANLSSVKSFFKFRPTVWQVRTRIRKIEHNYFVTFIRHTLDGLPQQGIKK